MATDRHEAAKRVQQRKPSGKHPFIGIEHRIFDSPAFVKLKPTAKVALFAIARQLRKDNNGHLQATFSWCTRYGIGSDLRNCDIDCCADHHRILVQPF